MTNAVGVEEEFENNKTAFMVKIEINSKFSYFFLHFRA